MTQQHPIIPSNSLILKWIRPGHPGRKCSEGLIEAAQWGADQELEACLTEVSFLGSRSIADKVRAARRPKPPSLKELALKALDEALRMADDAPPEGICSDQADIIRRALEQLDD